MSSEAANLPGYVSVAEYLNLKDKYESQSRELESLIETLELLEDTVDSLEKEKKAEALVSKKEIQKWEAKYGELKKHMEKLTEDVQHMMLPETEMERGSENPSVKCNTVSDEGVIMISDDDEDNQKQSNGGHLYSSKPKPKPFIL